MADAEFFFDPVCPWAWVTSRWVTEVSRLRDLDVRWRFICLRLVNAERGYAGDEGHERVHDRGRQALRIAAAVRAGHGEAAVADWYTAVGTAIHVRAGGASLAEDPAAFFTAALGAAGLPTALAASADDAGHDALLQAETDEALSRTGKNVGTPIITFGDPVDGHSFFGPVISTAPKGDDALALWDAVSVLAATGGFAELKRSNRGRPIFD